MQFVSVVKKTEHGADATHSLYSAMQTLTSTQLSFVLFSLDLGSLLMFVLAVYGKGIRRWIGSDPVNA